MLGASYFAQHLHKPLNVISILLSFGLSHWTRLHPCFLILHSQWIPVSLSFIGECFLSQFLDSTPILSTFDSSLNLALILTFCTRIFPYTSSISITYCLSSDHSFRLHIAHNHKKIVWRGLGHSLTQIPTLTINFKNATVVSCHLGIDHRVYSRVWLNYYPRPSRCRGRQTK